jgi:hypothetical protein
MGLEYGLIHSLKIVFFNKKKGLMIKKKKKEARYTDFLYAYVLRLFKQALA